MSIDLDLEALGRAARACKETADVFDNEANAALEAARTLGLGWEGEGYAAFAEKVESSVVPMARTAADACRKLSEGMEEARDLAESLLLRAENFGYDLGGTGAGVPVRVSDSNHLPFGGFSQIGRSTRECANTGIWVGFKAFIPLSFHWRCEMKKILTILCAAVLVLSLTACSGEPEHTISYVKAERMKLFDQYDCVAVYTQYTNGSSETAIPADWVDVKAFQNGVELGVLVPTGERIDGYIQCDTSVQSGVTADVVWFFQLDDDSEVSVEFSDGTKVEIPLTEE